jgi:hypothetical protein
VWRYWWVALPIVATIWLLSPVRVQLSFKAFGWHVNVAVQIKTILFTIRREFDVSARIAGALIDMIEQWRQAGEPVNIPLQKSMNRAPYRQMLQAISRPVRFLRRRLLCERLSIRGEIGGSDAMQTALLCGASWSFAGMAVSQMSRKIRLSQKGLRVQILPRFDRKAWRYDVECILRFRAGHSMVTLVWIAWRLLREPEFRLWARDSWRRKGAVSSGRAPDTRPNEDGHGEP